MFKRIMALFEKNEIPPHHLACPDCGGTGEFDVFIDCLECDGKGYIPVRDYYKKTYSNKRKGSE